MLNPFSITVALTRRMASVTQDHTSFPIVPLADGSVSASWTATLATSQVSFFFFGYVHFNLFGIPIKGRKVGRRTVLSMH